MSVPLRITVVSRFELVRSGLTTMIGGVMDGVVVDHDPTADVCLAEADVVVFDLADGGGEARELLFLLSGTTAVVGIARADGGGLISDARRLGVQCFIDERSSAREVARTVDEAATQRAQRPRSSQQPLSSRELDVLQLIAGGMTNQQVADKLFIGPNTVKSYIRIAYRKTGVRSRPEAVLWGVRHGLAE